MTITESITETITDAPVELDAERRELLETLATHRWFLRVTATGLNDEQARSHPTVSELCVGGLIKHVAAMEDQWVSFVVDGAAAMTGDGAEAEWADGFQLEPGETLDDVLATYDAVAARTEAVMTALPHLDVAHRLPDAPWFSPGASWSARRVLLHLIAETAQHAGHADIIRESIDGSKTMG